MGEKRTTPGKVLLGALLFFVLLLFQ